jgi:hypothetical protein
MAKQASSRFKRDLPWNARHLHYPLKKDFLFTFPSFRVIASEARQSINIYSRIMDCRVAKANRNDVMGLFANFLVNPQKQYLQFATGIFPVFQ